MIYVVGVVALIIGAVIGFAISDGIHEQVFAGLNKENSRLWHEIKLLRGRGNE